VLLGVDAGEEAAAFGRTPPRLAVVQGEVAFLRPGTEDWAPARANLPLAAGDRLTTREGAHLEIQAGPRAFLRAGASTELGLESHEPAALRFRVSAGLASLDVRGLPAGHGLAVDTPHAAVAIAGSGDYRFEVAAATSLTVRGGGAATLRAPGARPLVVRDGERVVVGEAGAKRHAAPAPDGWDRWSQRRTDEELDAFSTRYVGGDVYGAGDLDRHGAWRIVEPYGPVWIPRAVRAGWAPYSHGRWIWDPTFGWTWLDDAPWGWAPFHYGRWVSASGRWVWAPGPLGPRFYYAPALVAFYGGARTHVGWVPLGWGEPSLPWWGPRRWIGQPHWLGWSGPRAALGSYQNAAQPGGVIAVRGVDFGRAAVESVRVDRFDLDGLRRVRGALPVAHPSLDLLAPSVSTGLAPQGVIGRSASPLVRMPRAPIQYDAPGLERSPAVAPRFDARSLGVPRTPGLPR
jgi:hypothetical protein